MATSQNFLKPARLFHLYSGVFLAPAFLFFAFTGGIQTFSLHETTRGSAYKPPPILVTLGQLHKKQTVVVPKRDPPPAEAKLGDKPDHPGDHKNGQKLDQAQVKPPAPDTEPPSQARKHNLLPMKIFFLIVSIGFFFSTLTGLYMAYKYARRPSTITFTLLAGIVIPLLLLLF